MAIIHIIILGFHLDVYVHFFNIRNRDLFPLRKKDTCKKQKTYMQTQTHSKQITYHLPDVYSFSSLKPFMDLFEVVLNISIVGEVLGFFSSVDMTIYD